jgi:hypothetical protein
MRIAELILILSQSAIVPTVKVPLIKYLAMNLTCTSRNFGSLYFIYYTNLLHAVFLGASSFLRLPIRVKIIRGPAPSYCSTVYSIGCQDLKL